jgi:hypothetical protein
MGKQSSGNSYCSTVTPDQMNGGSPVNNATRRENQLYAMRKWICSRQLCESRSCETNQPTHARHTGKDQNKVHPLRRGRVGHERLPDLSRGEETQDETSQDAGG